jgi:succinate-semialdehyde dehydrogenase / glutarate-semialdehyde dehydrogenase
LRHSYRVRNPRSGALDFSFEEPSPEAIHASVSALRAAQRAWSAAEPERRAAALLTWASAIESDTALLDALCMDTGRYAIAALEIRAVVALIRRWAAQAPAILRATPSQGEASIPGIRYESLAQPMPVVGVISPWNFPLLLSMIDTIPALLAGAAAIIKPSEVAPRFAIEMNRLLASAPELQPVVRFVLGTGATGAAIVQSVDAVCFTGSVATGRSVAVAAAQRLIPAFLELGGKDPLIVLPGSDLERASDIALRASVQATGQACQSIERVYVPQADMREFTRLLVQKAERITLNTHDVRRGDLGPIIFAKQADIIEAQLADALSQGAQLLSGGKIERHADGLWLRPTILINVTHAMRIMTEESFGPIIPVMPYGDTDEALRLANDSEYGLSAAVIGPDLVSARAFAAHIEAGAVSINDAALTSLVFEAEKQAFKASGLGSSRMGDTGLTRFLRRKAYLTQHGAALALIGDGVA